MSCIDSQNVSNWESGKELLTPILLSNQKVILPCYVFTKVWSLYLNSHFTYLIRKMNYFYLFQYGLSNFLTYRMGKNFPIVTSRLILIPGFSEFSGLGKCSILKPCRHWYYNRVNFVHNSFITLKEIEIKSLSNQLCRAFLCESEIEEPQGYENFSAWNVCQTHWKNSTSWSYYWHSK